MKNLSYSDSESEDEECRRFFSVCAENKINAMIARMREYDENFDRPEEFENEAVSMAIQQHGLKNYERQCGTEINENNYNQNVVEDSVEATTSKMRSPEIIEDCNKDEHICSKRKQRKQFSNSEIQNVTNKQTKTAETYEINDTDFLNEAVAVAIRKKGLSSSSYKPLDLQGAGYQQNQLLLLLKLEAPNVKEGINFSFNFKIQTKTEVIELERLVYVWSLKVFTDLNFRILNYMLNKCRPNKPHITDYYISLFKKLREVTAV